MRGYLLRQLWCKDLPGVSSGPGRVVELSHELTAGGASGGEILVSFFELHAQVDDLLLQVRDLLVVGGEQVGLQRGSGDGRASAVAGGWSGLECVDLLQQVTVPVEERPVDSGCAGDPGRAGLRAVGGCPVERGDDALAAARGVGLAAFQHRSRSEEHTSELQSQSNL